MNPRRHTGTRDRAGRPCTRRDEPWPSSLSRAFFRPPLHAQGRGNSWTRARVCVLRNHRRIPPYREGERAERGELTLEEAAKVLEVSEATVRRLIKEKVLPATQHCKGAPWVIRADDLDNATVKQTADARRQRRPPSEDQRQNTLAL